MGSGKPVHARRGAAVAVWLGLFCLAGCASSAKRDAVPSELAHAASIPGMPDVRAWGGEASPTFQASIAESIRQVRRLHPEGLVGPEGYVNILAISGGGANGAYGVGVLAGWSQCAAHPRPTFKIVSGISTGALIAPFAFLGADYDATISRLYTSISTKDILRKKNLFQVMSDRESIADSKPLAAMLDKVITPELVEAVAQAHAEGRRLYISTTNLDALRQVVWDMGAIATYRMPESLALFRRVMLASASIPVAFPPVRFAVDAGGKRYEELHVDGGIQAPGLPLRLHARPGRGPAERGPDPGHRRRAVPDLRPAERPAPAVVPAGRDAPAADRDAVGRRADRQPGRGRPDPDPRAGAGEGLWLPTGLHPQRLRAVRQGGVRPGGDEPPVSLGIRAGQERLRVGHLAAGDRCHDRRDDPTRRPRRSAVDGRGNGGGEGVRR